MVAQYESLAHKISKSSEPFDELVPQMKTLIAQILTKLEPHSKIGQQLKITDKFIDILQLALTVTDETAYE